MCSLLGCRSIHVCLCACLGRGIMQLPYSQLLDGVFC